MNLEISGHEALTWCCRGFGLALVQQAAESLLLGRAFRALGLWRSGDLVQGGIVNSAVQVSIHSARFALGLALLGLGPSAALPLATLLTLFGLVPTEGAANGGSDGMTVTLGLGLSGSWMFRDHPVGAWVGLYFIAVHGALSYFLAGVTKLKEPTWRDGRAIGGLVQLTRYAAGGQVATWLLRRGPFSRALSVGVLAFECAFPVALFRSDWALGFFFVGAVFHVANARLLGLHRFWPVWLATYPAIYWVSAGRLSLVG
jgi:hypothetical protein